MKYQELIISNVLTYPYRLFYENHSIIVCDKEDESKMFLKHADRHVDFVDCDYYKYNEEDDPRHVVADKKYYRKDCILEVFLK